MSTKLTKKQDIFVKSYLETGIGTTAAKEAYDIREGDELTPRVIASENLTKPNIIKALAERISDDELEEAHKSLLKQVRLDYFVFAKSLSDEEITAHVEAQGITVLNIRPTEKGKMAFFSIPDAQARGKALELGYKLKGSFAPDKHITLTLKAEPSERIKKLGDILNK